MLIWVNLLPDKWLIRKEKGWIIKKVGKCISLGYTISFKSEVLRLGLYGTTCVEMLLIIQTIM